MTVGLGPGQTGPSRDHSCGPGRSGTVTHNGLFQRNCDGSASDGTDSRDLHSFCSENPGRHRL